MAYDIFKAYGLHKVHDSMTENYDFKDNNASVWKLVKTKDVLDSDGFTTDYSWYTDGVKHIFMFGDVDLYEPDEDYADWVTESESEASDWFDSYTGFDAEDNMWEALNTKGEQFDSLDGDADFMNSGFDRVYSCGDNLED